MNLEQSGIVSPKLWEHLMHKTISMSDISAPLITMKN